MKLTYYGHACFSVQIGNRVLMFDPFISPNPLAKDIDVNAIHADYILISHGHNDHVADALEIARRCNATIVCNFEVMGWFNKLGYNKCHPMNKGGNWSFPEFKVKMTHAVHSSGMPDGSYGGSSSGFIIYGDDKQFYYSGDTGLTTDMKLIPQYWATLDFALLPVGDNFTMGVGDAIIAAGFIECKKIIGVHYDTFGYIEINHETAKQQFANAGLQLLLPKIGETIDL